MFFDDDDDVLFNPEIFHVVRRELLTLGSNLENTPYGLRSVPTHTEDGIPIRKLYVANLPPKTTRTELFGVFAQYGFIRSCWLRMEDKGPNKTPMPTYAFVTFSDPADAHKALLAPCHEKTLRGRNLRISPADSWHQPVEEGEVKIRWKPKTCQKASEDSTKQDTNDDNGDEMSKASSSNNINSNTSKEESQAIVETVHDSTVTDHSYLGTFDILQVLNRDCLHHVFSFIPLRDLIRSEAVSKTWQNSIQEYLESVRVFKTSWWQHVPVTLTTAVLRRVLQRLSALLRLHIDHHWSALNDRTAHTIGKFCPGLEELKVVGMHTKNWNPLIYGCKNLKHVAFVSCNKLTDSSLVHLVKPDSCIESMTVANNTHVTGLFLTGSSPPKLTSLSFYNCYSLQGTVLSAALDTLRSLKCLKLDVCPVTMWKIIPLILKKLPGLEELSLSEYTSIEICFTPEGNNVFCEALATLTELRTLNLSRNIYITNVVLKQISQSCTKLESLNISGCNPRKGFPHSLSAGSVYPGVSDEGVTAVCAGCSALQWLDVSYLGALSDAGMATAARLRGLTVLVARGNAQLSAQPFAAALAACHHLEVLHLALRGQPTLLKILEKTFICHINVCLLWPIHILKHFAEHRGLPPIKEVDVCGCDGVTEEIVAAGVRALTERPRALLLRLAGTAAALPDHSEREIAEYPTHKLLTLDLDEDRSNPQLRPDFEDHVFEDSSDDSLQDMYDEEFDGFLGHDDDDDDIFLDDGEFEDYEGIAFGLNAPIILL